MRVLVLGAGVSGRAAAALLARLEIDYRVYDRNRENLAHLDPPDGGLVAGSWDPVALEGIDLVITSPGFTPASAPIRAVERAGIPVWSELEFAVRRLECPLIAVTGTNGKTTIVEQATSMLQESGIAAAAAGNIGPAASDMVPEDPDVAVLEVSSFQMVHTHSLAPEVAVIVNVAEDHLDWHGSRAAYRAAKARIYRHFDDTDLLVYDATDPGAAALAARAPGRKAPVTGAGRLPPGTFGMVGNRLILPSGTVSLDVTPVVDPAYRVNLAAAAVSASEMGADLGAVARVVSRFRHRDHRRKVVGEWGGVTWVNDSKATNPHAAAAAVGVYPSVVLIAGGRNKGLDLAPLVARPNLRALIAIGESGPELLRLASGYPAAPASSMEQAVAMAGERAVPGDTVLLSPGCASFDMFGSYEERGAVFSRSVRDYIDKSGTAGKPHRDRVEV